MKKLLLLAFLFSLPVTSIAQVECRAGSLSFTLINNSNGTLQVVLKNESVLADGILTNTEVDLVARFRTVGEITLFSKVGVENPGNYVFLQGQRMSVSCR